MSLKIIVSILLIIISLQFIIFGLKLESNRKISMIVLGTILFLGSLIFLVIPSPCSNESIYKDYLTKVYPAMDQNKCAKDYENLYHSLAWYYQCCNINVTLIEYRQESGIIMGKKLLVNWRRSPIIKICTSMANQNKFTMASLMIKSTYMESTTMLCR